jgi:hypothetical protein
LYGPAQIGGDELVARFLTPFGLTIMARSVSCDQGRMA